MLRLEQARQMAERGWLTQHWPSAYGGRDATPWRHAVVGEEMWAIGEPSGPIENGMTYIVRPRMHVVDLVTWRNIFRFTSI